MSKLLTREEFRNAVMQRDNYKCVFCDTPAADAHHILERRLWPDSGYYLENGASVCSEHHLECERTNISVEEVRAACGITKPVIPPHLYSDVIYDKWGNVVSNRGLLKGELFFDESVQKVIAHKLDQFTSQVKYPRTYHLPWSEGMHDDDRMMRSTLNLRAEEIIVTEKRDGENTTMYRDYIHARSIDSSGRHPSRHWVQNLWNKISYLIPDGWRVCGENMYAKHSIAYDNLETYFEVISIWNEFNECLSWDETVEWAELFDLKTVKVLYRGPYDQAKIMACYDPKNREKQEGYVVRVAEKFDYRAFRHMVGKFVRKDHVMTTPHWMHGQQMVSNSLRKEHEHDSEVE